MYLPEPGYKRIMVITFYVLLAAAALFVFFKYLFVGFLPFIIGWFFACIIQKPVLFLSKHKIPRKLTSLLCVLLTLGVVGLIIGLAVNRLISEATGFFALVSRVNDNLPQYVDDFTLWLENALINIPFLNAHEIVAGISENINEWLVVGLQSITPYLPTVITPIVKFVPYSIVFVIVTVIAACYFSLDYEKIKKAVWARLPEKVSHTLTEVKKQLFDTVVKYIRAYLAIIFITFTELFVGFSILGVQYSLLLAVITAIIDVFPILGTGTVLIPWGIVSLLRGNYVLGIGILVLYGAITLVRQIIEPKIVGDYIGLYPLVTLMCMYVGLRLFGIVGLFLLPISVIILKNLHDKGIIKTKK